VSESEKIVKEILNSDIPSYYTNPHSTASQVQRHALIRIDSTDAKTMADIIQKVRQLPPYIKVEINPERIV
jgi:hypothetical protein